MADEITVTQALGLANGALDSFSIPAYTFRVTQSTAVPVRVGGSQVIPHTEHVALTTTGLTTLGIGYFRNRSATNFVQIGVEVDATFYPMVRLNPGEAWMFRFAQGITPYAQANTAAVVLQREILDN